MTPGTDSILHLAGLFGALPSDAADRTCGAVRTLVGDPVTSAEAPGLVVAAGPTTNLAGLSDSSICVVAGPLYDRAELAGRLDLPQKTAPDQLVSAAFQRWSDGVLAHLTSEAAIVVWDLKARRGFIARDPLGASSVFWSRQNGLLAFATELRILLALLRRRPAPDSVGVAHWLRHEVSRPELTLYEGVSQLRVGDRIRLNANGSSVESYWRPIYEPPERLSMQDAVDLVRPVLSRAVERRLAPAGHTGVLLSGGVDSTSVAGFAQALQPRVRGYSTVFPDRPKVDESRWIDAMAASAKISVVRIAPQPAGYLEDAVDFVRRWSAPPDGWDAWGVKLYRQAADDGVSVLLTGDAAEALFDTRLRLIGDRLRSGRLLAARGLAWRAPLGFFHPPPRLLLQILWQEAVPAIVPSLSSRVQSAQERRRQPGWLQPEVARTLRETAGTTLGSELDGPAWWRQPAYRLTVTLSAHGLLQDLRRRGERVGMSARTPFLDIDLVRLALRLPPDLGFNGTLTKPVLRAAIHGHVPDSVRLRPLKTDWKSLVIDLVAGDDWPAIRSLLGDPSAEISQFVRHDRFADEMLEHAPARNDPAAWPWATNLLRLSALEVWLRQEAGRSL